MRYLRYWWNPRSIIDPTNAKDNYYAVIYDNKGRRVKIVEYSNDGEILYYQRDYWKGSWPVQTERYSSDNILQHTITYHYNILGFLVEKRIISKDGRVSGNVLNRERDVLDSLNQWLSDLIGFPIVEATGLFNYIKGLIVNQWGTDHRRIEDTND